MNGPSHPSSGRASTGGRGASKAQPSQVLALVLSWSAVGLPLAWGVAETLRKTLALFQ